MVSEKAINLLHYLVDKFNSSGRNSFDNTDYIAIRNHEKLLSELCSAGLLVYDEESLIGHVELTQDGISYKF